MIRASMFGANRIGLVPTTHSKLPFCVQQYSALKFSNSDNFQLVPERIAKRSAYLSADRMLSKCSATGRHNPILSFDDDFPPEPFLLGLTKEALWGLRSLYKFLVEQPSQLRYIEWPRFKSTLKTATLTLILVALLIVALSSVDSVLCFFLALLLRRTPS